MVCHLLDARTQPHLCEIAKIRSFWEKEQRATEKQMEGQHKGRHEEKSTHRNNITIPKILDDYNNGRSSTSRWSRKVRKVKTSVCASVTNSVSCRLGCSSCSGDTVITVSGCLRVIPRQTSRIFISRRVNTHCGHLPVRRAPRMYYWYDNSVSVHVLGLSHR